MINDFSLKGLVIPNYPEERIFLKDPTEARDIDELAMAVETDLNILNGIAGLEEADMSSPFSKINLVGYGLESHGFGLEAGSVREKSKQIFFKFKSTVKRFSSYVFGFFLNILRGSTDVKAVISKYNAKTKKYISDYKTLDRNFKSETEIEIKDVKNRILTSLSLILMMTNGLESILNEMNAVKDKPLTDRLSAFAKGIQHLNGMLLNDEFGTEKFNEQVLKQNGDIKSVSVFVKFTQLIKELFTGVKSKDRKPISAEISDENNKNVKAKIEQLKELYKEEVEVKSLGNKEAFEYCNSGLLTIVGITGSKSNNWNFKSITNKLQSIQRSLDKEVGRMDNSGAESDDKKDKNEAKLAENSLKIIMNAGAQLSMTQTVVSVTLKSFKVDMETYYTQCAKVGSKLYKKQ